MSETNSSSEAVACPICACIEGNRVVDTREMMFGTREAFRYGACARCGTWWLLDPPADLSPYYPPEYYAFDAPHVRASQALKHALGKPLLSLYLDGPAWLRSAIEGLRGYPPEVRCLGTVGATLGSSLIDVGTGSGKYLVKLHRLGFSDLTGVDKFVPESVPLGFGMDVIRGEAKDINRQFDIVTSHHSFEHAADPRAELAALANLSKPGGIIVIRTPNADSRVCRKYEGNWFELDPPRHLVVPTPTAMELLADELELEVELVTWDAEAQSIAFSERYAQGVPLYDENFAISAAGDNVLSAREAKRAAAQDNARGEGDRMCVVLRKPAKA